MITTITETKPIRNNTGLTLTQDMEDILRILAEANKPEDSFLNSMVENVEVECYNKRQWRVNKKISKSYVENVANWYKKTVVPNTIIQALLTGSSYKDTVEIFNISNNQPKNTNGYTYLANGRTMFSLDKDENNTYVELESLPNGIVLYSLSFDKIIKRRTCPELSGFYIRNIDGITDEEKFYNSELMFGMEEYKADMERYYIFNIDKNKDILQVQEFLNEYIKEWLIGSYKKEF